MTSEKEITIRSANLEDLPILLKFEQGVIDAERPMDPSLRLDKIHYYDLAALITSDQAEVLVALVDNEIVGSGYAKIEKSKSWHKQHRHSYLGFMYTLPTYRGMGVNRHILEGLAEWSKRQGVYDLFLDVYDNNPAAIRAYEKFGFEKRLVEMRVKLE